MGQGFNKHNFSWVTLDACLALGAKLSECAGFMSCSPDTIQGRIKSEYEMTFSEYRDCIFGKTLLNLRKAQWDKALKGDTTMQIWLGKNELGQSDKLAEAVEPSSNQITLRYSIPGNKYSGGNVVDAEAKPMDETLPAVVDQVDDSSQNYNEDETFAGD